MKMKVLLFALMFGAMTWVIAGSCTETLNCGGGTTSCSSDKGEIEEHTSELWWWHYLLFQ